MKQENMQFEAKMRDEKEQEKRNQIGQILVE